MEEIEPAGHEIAPGRHAGQTADEVIVESDAARGEAPEVWRGYGRSAIALEHVPVERVEEDKDRTHCLPC
jgi:hypothetical protein